MHQRLFISFSAPLALSLLAIGCIKPATTQVRFVSTAETNGGRPLALIVRKSDSQSFRKDSYVDMERLFLTPDASVLRSLTVFPSEQAARCIDFPYQRTNGYAIYALYENAAGDWKILYEPTTPYRLELRLGPHQIDVMNSREKRPLFSSRDAEAAVPEQAVKDLSKRAKPRSAASGSEPENPSSDGNPPSLTPVPAIPSTPLSPKKTGALAP